MAWARKNDAVTTFKHSEYWEWIVDGLKASNPNLTEDIYRGHRWWKDSKKGKELEDQAYNKLIEDKVVKFIEISPVPNW